VFGINSISPRNYEGIGYNLLINKSFLPVNGVLLDYTLVTYKELKRLLPYRSDGLYIHYS